MRTKDNTNQEGKDIVVHPCTVRNSSRNWQCSSSRRLCGHCERHQSRWVNILCRLSYAAVSIQIIQVYYKLFIRFENVILSKVQHVQIRLIYETNRKLTKFVMCAPVGSTSLVPLENGDKARKEF
jgi:hypothetical protein